MIRWRCRYWSSEGGKCKDGTDRRLIDGKKLEECLAKGCRKLQSFVPREKSNGVEMESNNRKNR